MKDSVQLVTVIVQSLFYLTVGVVTVLTYRRARATILQPMRAEIFKAQLALLTKLLHHFVGKSSCELIDEFGLRKTAEGNIMKMAGAYGRIMFDFEPLGQPPWEGPEFPSGITTIEKWRSSGFSDSEHPQEAPETYREPMSPSVRASIWSRYEHDEYVISDIQCNKAKQLKDALESPLMPKACAEKVDAFLSAIEEATFSIGRTLAAQAHRFPEEYRDVNELANAHFLWICNQCTGNLADLEPYAKAVIETVREYFSPDRLVTVD